MQNVRNKYRAGVGRDANMCKKVAAQKCDELGKHAKSAKKMQKIACRTIDTNSVILVV